MPISRRLPVPAVFGAGIALGLGAALVWASITSGQGNGSPGAGAGGSPTRASIEALLAERPVVPTGQIRRFALTVKETAWELVPGVTTTAVTFNGTVPGPTIRVTEGDTVEIAVTNSFAEPTSIHWHGLHVPNAQDGVGGVTQPMIEPGQTFTYTFTAPHAGTFMYHAHGTNSREQIDRGLYAPFIIDPAGGDAIKADKEVTLTIGNWMVGNAAGDMPGMDMGSDASMSMEYDYFTINGKSYPATEAITVTEGQLVRLRFLNPSQTIHPMHLHGTDMAVVAKDGEPLAEPQRINTLDLGQGETYDVVFLADNPGTWLLHCHDLHHASNAGVEPGGLIVSIVVTAAGSAPGPSGSEAPASPAPSQPAHTMAPEMTQMPGMESMPGMDH
ncbi:MAG TPA: multicopper oxidase domain-containing protein [Candidatus Limnocylindrales bacterium]